MDMHKHLTTSRPPRPSDYGSPSGIHIPAAIIAALGLLACLASICWAVMP